MGAPARGLPGQPLELSASYYPASIAEGTPLSGLGKIAGGAPKVFANLGLPPRAFVDRVSARPPTREEVEMLDLPVRAPVIRQLRVVSPTTTGQSKRPYWSRERTCTSFSSSAWYPNRTKLNLDRSRFQADGSTPAPTTPPGSGMQEEVRAAEHLRVDPVIAPDHISLTKVTAIAAAPVLLHGRSA